MIIQINISYQAKLTTPFLAPHNPAGSRNNGPRKTIKTENHVSRIDKEPRQMMLIVTVEVMARKVPKTVNELGCVMERCIRRKRQLRLSTKQDTAHTNCHKHTHNHPSKPRLEASWDILDLRLFGHSLLRPLPASTNEKRSPFARLWRRKMLWMKSTSSSNRCC